MDYEEQINKLQYQIDQLKQRRTYQSDVVPSAIKQRHMGEGNRFIRSGLDADLPSSGEGTTDNSSPIYYATDTGILYTWNGTEWLGGSETLISDKITSQMTASGSSFTDFSPELSLTFIPKYTKKYLIFGNYRSSTSSTDDIGKIIINNESGSANILIQNETSYYVIPSDISSFPCYVYMIAELIKGIEYKFTLQGKQDYSDKDIIIKSSTYGNYLVAQSL